MDRITQTWVHCSKFTGRSIRARNLEDSFVHSQQHLLQENVALRQSLEDMTRQQASQPSRSALTDRYEAHARSVEQWDSSITSSLPICLHVVAAIHCEGALSCGLQDCLEQIKPVKCDISAKIWYICINGDSSLCLTWIRSAVD